MWLQLDACASYHQEIRNAPHDIGAHYTAALDLVPSNIMRDALLRYCNGTEAFFALRKQFVRSISAFSISSYILGIGDRHLDNFLLDTSTGKPRHHFCIRCR